MRVSLIIIALALLSLPAGAQDKAAEAKRLFKAGRDLMKVGKIEQACQRFEQSRILATTIGVLLNLADCNEQLGRLQKASLLWRESVDLLRRANDGRLKIAEQRLEAIQEAIPTVEVRLTGDTPEGTQIRIGDLVIDASRPPFPVPLDTGEHTVTITAPGHHDNSATIVLDKGDARALSMRVGPPTDGSTTPVPIGPEPGEDSDMSGQSIAAITLMAIGGAGVVAWAVSGALYIADASTVDEQCTADGFCETQAGADAGERGKTLGVINTVSLIVGVTATLVGVVLYVTDDDPQSARLELAPLRLRF